MASCLRPGSFSQRQKRKIVAGGQQFRIKLQRLIVQPLSVGTFAFGRLQRTQRIVRLGGIRREHLGFQVRSLRILAAIQPLVNQAEVVRQIAVLRGQPHGLLIGADRRAVIANLSVGQGFVVQRIRPVLRTANGIMKRWNGLIVFGLFQVCDAKRIVSIGGVRVDANGLLQQLRRIREFFVEQ